MGIVGAGAFVTCPVFVSEIAEDKYTLTKCFINQFRLISIRIVFQSPRYTWFDANFKHKCWCLIRFCYFSVFGLLRAAQN